ncbi:MAG TPA: peptidase M24, partial [Colwellia sp.]|nr:peptidase M24 [Colwellia sp.]
MFLRLPKKHRLFIVSISVFLLLLMILPTEQELTTQDASNKGFALGKRYQVAMPQQASTSITDSTIKIPSIKDTVIREASSPSAIVSTVNSQQQNNISWQTAKVRSGDSIARIFKRLGFSAQETYAVSTAQGKDSKLLLKINVGDTLRIARNDKNRVTALEYPLSKIDTLYINLVGDKFQSHKESKTVEIRQAFAHGTISSSFWNAGTIA